MRIQFFVIFLIVNLSVMAQKTMYGEKFFIACHNCYDTKYTNAIEDVFPYTTTIELDIWDTRKWFGIGGWKAMTNDWYVRHNPTDNGNINCCGGSFRDCLIRINNWSIQNPNHEPITIFIDKKENWSEPNETRKPTDLDNLLLSVFSKDRIFTPSDLLGKERSLKDAAIKNNWYSLDSLRGKLIFVLTNGTEITTRNPLNEYLDIQKRGAICFVCPEIGTEVEILDPKDFSDENIRNIVFYNLRYINHNLSMKINNFNCLSRVYDAPETIEVYDSLVKEKVNFIALNNYKLLH